MALLSSRSTFLDTKRTCLYKQQIQPYNWNHTLLNKLNFFRENECRITLSSSNGKTLPRRYHGFISSALKNEEKCENVDGIRNKIGLHALVWVGGWSKEECRHAISSTASLGYDLIEVPVLVPEEIDIQHTKSVLTEFGLSSATSLGLSFDRDVSSDDPDVAARGEQLLLDALHVASGIGASVLTGVTYSAMGKYPNAFPGGERQKKLAKILRHVAVQAEDKGVKLGLEIVNRYESNVLNTTQQGLELLEEINHKNIFLHLDAYHMNIEEGNLAKAIELCGNKLEYFHVGESHRGYLGSGSIDWNEVFRSLMKIEYSHPLTFESFSSSVVSQSLSNNLCVWRNLWDDSNDLASHAKSFIESQLISAKKS